MSVVSLLLFSSSLVHVIDQRRAQPAHIMDLFRDGVHEATVFLCLLGSFSRHMCTFAACSSTTMSNQCG